MKGKQKAPDVDQAVIGGSSKIMRAPDDERIAEKTKAIDKTGNVIEDKLKGNRRRLGVDEDHKTPEMKKGKRGTFP